ncbi:MAG: YtjB family periplasmic protein [Vibrionaceae bacterium]
MLQINKQRLMKFCQLLLLVASCGTLVALFIYSEKLNRQNYQMLYSQTDALARVISRQVSQNSVELIARKDHRGMKKMIEQLSKEPLILDVTMYDQMGTVLSQSPNAIALEDLTGLRSPLAIEGIGRHQLVEPVIGNGRLIGFVRLTLEHGQLIKEASEHLEQSIKTVRLMLIAAFVIGVFVLYSLAKRIEFRLTPYLSRRHHLEHKKQA